MMDVPTKIADIYLYCMLCLESSRRPFSFKIFKGQTDKKITLNSVLYIITRSLCVVREASFPLRHTNTDTVLLSFNRFIPSF